MTTKMEQLEHEARMIAIQAQPELEMRKVAALEEIAASLTQIATAFNYGLQIQVTQSRGRRY